MKTIVAVIKNEGLHSALVRGSERLEETFLLQKKMARQLFEKISPNPILNVLGMPAIARLGGVPIQLRARLAVEKTFRQFALYTPQRLETATLARATDNLASAIELTKARFLHLEGSFGLDLDAILQFPKEIILSLHDTSLLKAPKSQRDALIKRARQIIFPSEYLRNLYGVDGDILAPAGETGFVSHAPSNGTRVAFVGSLKHPKGAHLLPHLVQSTSVEWHLFGGGDVGLFKALRGLSNLVIHGYYRANQLPVLLNKHRIGLVVLPSTTPESFGLTLSESWLAGIPAVVFDHGAMAERIRTHGGGFIVPIEQGVAGIARTISAWQEKSLQTTIPVNIPTAEQAAQAHIKIYQSLL